MKDINLYSYMIVLMIQCLGAWEHWRVMKSEGRVSGTFRQYLFSHYPGRSFSIYIALAGSAWASCLSGAGDNLNPELLFAIISNGKISIETATIISAVAVTTFGFGYAIDSRFNKGKNEPIREAQP